MRGEINLNQLLEQATKYAQLGMKLFPLSPLSKIPLKNTKGSKEATTNLSQLEKWWEQTPQANIGIVTDQFLVIDIDVHNEESNGYKSLEVLENTFEPLPDTLRVKTANGGLHIYLMKPKGVELPQKVAILKGIDIKAHPNNYIVAPPSKVKRSDNTIGDYQVINKQSIVECPEWLINFIFQSNVTTVQTVTSNNVARYRSKTTELLEKLAKGMDEGSRNDTVASVTGQLLTYGVKSSYAWELVQFMNNNSHLPLDQKELEHTFLSICRRELNTI